MNRVTAIRDHIKAIAGAVPGLKPDRVVLGVDDHGPAVEFLKTLKDAGPYLLIRPAETGAIDMWEKLVVYNIQCQLWFAFASDADHDFRAQEEILYAPLGLIPALADLGKWELAELPPPETIEAIDRPTLRTDLKPIVGTYTMNVLFHTSLG